MCIAPFERAIYIASLSGNYNFDRVRSRLLCLLGKVNKWFDCCYEAWFVFGLPRRTWTGDRGLDWRQVAFGESNP